MRENKCAARRSCAVVYRLVMVLKGKTGARVGGGVAGSGQMGVGNGHGRIQLREESIYYAVFLFGLCSWSSLSRFCHVESDHVFAISTQSSTLALTLPVQACDSTIQHHQDDTTVHLLAILAPLHPCTSIVSHRQRVPIQAP